MQLLKQSSILIWLALIGLALLIPSATYGQIKPDFLPEDIQSGEIRPICFCKPGVRDKSRSKGLKLIFGNVAGGTFDDEDFELTQPLTSYKHIRQFELDVKAPVMLKEKFNILVGYKLYKESFKFDQIGLDYGNILSSLRGDNLRSSSLSVYMTKPLDEKKYIVAVARFSSNGNYGQFMSFRNEYAIFKFYGVYAFKPNEDKEWGIGINISKNFRRTSIIPFIVWNKNFNRRWGIEAVLPGSIYARYNISPDAIGLFGIEYSSKSFRIIQKNSLIEPFDYAYNHSEISATMRIEKRLISWVWAKARAGFRYNFSSDFESKNSFFSDFNVEPTNGLFFQFGIFVSPQMTPN